MKLVFLSNDLFFASRVRGACQAKGYQFVFSGKLPDPATTTDVSLVIVDLSAPGNQPAEVVPAIRRDFPEAELIAYAPHVHANDLRDARDAGFDTVMTRGQFNAWMQRT
jgi:DNA-binding NarL/FixJ family response regulator